MPAIWRLCGMAEVAGTLPPHPATSRASAKTLTYFILERRRANGDAVCVEDVRNRAHDFPGRVIIDRHRAERRIEILMRSVERHQRDRRSLEVRRRAARMEHVDEVFPECAA